MMNLIKKYFLGFFVLIILGFLTPVVLVKAASYSINNVACGQSSQSGYTTALCNAHIIVNNDTPLDPGERINAQFYMDLSGYGGLIGGPNIVKFNGEDGLMNSACGNNCLKAWTPSTFYAPSSNGCYTLSVNYAWTAWSNPLYGGGPYNYTHLIPYQVGNVNCTGGNNGGGSPNPNYNIPGVSIYATNQTVNSGGNTTVSWVSSNSSDCQITNNYGESITTGVSGSFNTGPLNENTTYIATCQGNLALESIKNNLAKEKSYLNIIKENILSLIPKAVADMWNPPNVPPVVSASVTISIQDDPVVSLALKTGQEKDLVKKNSLEPIGTTYLQIFVNNLPTGEICTLVNTTNGVEYDPYQNSSNIKYKDISSLQNDNNNFQLQCTDPALDSSIVNVKAQSGTLNVASCTIPIGGSTCPSQTILWTTINPDSGSPTAIFQNNTQIIQTSNNGSSSVILNGNGIPNGGTSQTITFDSRNRVDGETTGSSVSNTLDTKQVTVSCASGSTWVGGVCLASTVNRPDLIASGITPTTAVAGIARTFTSTITNQGNADTDYEGVNTFTNLFQTATGFDDPTSQLGPLGLNSYAVTGMGILDSNGGSSNTNRSITFPTAGTYYIRVCADKNSPTNTGLINESNENNNCSHPWTAITVTSSARPDLTAGETTPSSAVVNVGRTYTASIRNQGTASTGIGFQNSFQTATGFDDPTLFLGPENLQNYNASSSMSALGVGVSATATSPTITFSNTGNYYMRACADIPPANPGTVTNESNENNNCGPWSIVSVGISATVDLRASAPTQNTATIGVPMNFTSIISNQGNTVTENSFYNTFQVATEANGGGTLTRINSTPSPMPALTPGGLATATSVSHTFTGLPTTRSVRACADINSLGVGRITETNETNNCSLWTNVTFPSSNTTGTVSATNCLIASGSSTCRTTLNWNTVNPVSGGISAVTTTPPENTIVRTGLSGTNYDYEISHGNHPFYLYHSLPTPTLLAQTNANASCALLTDVWDGAKCSPISTVSGNLTIIPNSCIIASGESTCTVKGATWTTNNAIKPALIDVNTGLTLSNLANNSEPLEVWASYPQTVFNLTHDGDPSVLDTERVSTVCASGNIWDGSRCSPSGAGTIDGACGPSEINNPCIAGDFKDLADSSESYIWQCMSIPEGGYSPICTEAIGGSGTGGGIDIIFEAKPSRIFKGRSSVLTWEATGATSCTGDNFDTMGQINGSLSVKPNSTTLYTLTCKDDDDNTGVRTAEVKVSVIKFFEI